MRAEYDLKSAVVKRHGIAPQRCKAAARLLGALIGKLPPADLARSLPRLPMDPCAADADTAWSVIWPRPLYSNANAATGAAWEEQLRPFMAGAWKRWGKGPGAFCIHHDGLGNARAPESYSLHGKQAARIRGACAVPAWRLFAIQNAAAAFRGWAKQDSRPLRTFSKTPLKQLVPCLERELGAGWGQMTILHLLADLGLAVRPDMHLVRTMHHLGLWPGPSLARPGRDAVPFVLSVLKFAKEHLDIKSPKELRRLDWQLTSLSLHEVIPPLSRS